MGRHGGGGHQESEMFPHHHHHHHLANYTDSSTSRYNFTIRIRKVDFSRKVTLGLALSVRNNISMNQALQSIIKLS